MNVESIRRYSVTVSLFIFRTLLQDFKFIIHTYARANVRFRFVFLIWPQIYSNLFDLILFDFYFQNNVNNNAAAPWLKPEAAASNPFLS